jgi:hypothetical protein
MRARTPISCFVEAGDVVPIVLLLTAPDATCTIGRAILVDDGPSAA